MPDDLTSYVAIGIIVPLAVWFIIRPSSHVDRAWDPGTRIKIAVWVGLTLLSIWVMTSVVWPFFFEE